jgi:hypothetical protein
MDNEFKPYKTDEIMGDYYKHPTFGMISICRTQGQGTPLFGSSILHNHTIRITISHAELCRNLNNDHYFDRERIVEFEMSSTQFADAITSLNVGCGTPVTLRWLPNNPLLYKMETPYQNKVAQFNEEFQQDINNISKNFDDVIKLAEETHAQKRLIREIELLKQGFKNNLPFVNKQFSEQMEQTIKEAKGEVEAFVTKTVQNYGIEAIRKQAPQLPEINNNAKMIDQ